MAGTASGRGHSRLFRFNDRHDLAPTLAALFQAESERFAAILDAVRHGVSERPVFSLFVYGSAARGNDGPGSDLDIGLVAGADELAEVVEGLREALRDPAERLAFLPNVRRPLAYDWGALRRRATPVGPKTGGSDSASTPVLQSNAEKKERQRMRYRIHDSELENLRAVTSDLSAIRRGGLDVESLWNLPILDHVTISQRPVVCLEGLVSGHPLLPDNHRILTPALYGVFGERTLYARTLSRRYRLGETVEIGED